MGRTFIFKIEVIDKINFNKPYEDNTNGKVREYLNNNYKEIVDNNK